jgi:hypothetical protein
VMKNPLVQLQLQRRQNEINFASHQESCIRQVLASVGMEANQQIFSSAPPLSHAGERAALDAAGDDVWNAFKRSRNLELDEETSAKFQALVGDFQIFSKQVAREETRASALSGFIGFNSRTVAACSALLNQQKQEETTTVIAATERFIRIGTSKFTSVLERVDTAVRHSDLWRRSENKSYHARNFHSCCATARMDYDAGCFNYHQADQNLANNLTGFDDSSEAAIEDLRMEFCALHPLKANATACLVRFVQLEEGLVLEPAAAPHAAVDDAHEMIVPFNNDGDAAAALPLVIEGGNQVLGVVANRRFQRKCSKCGSFEHRSDNRLCPGVAAPVEPAANNVAIP